MLLGSMQLSNVPETILWRYATLKDILDRPDHQSRDPHCAADVRSHISQYFVQQNVSWSYLELDQGIQNSEKHIHFVGDRLFATQYDAAQPTAF